MHIVIGVDGSESSRIALELVAAIGWRPGTLIRVVTAADSTVARTGASADERAAGDEPALGERVRLLAEPLLLKGHALEHVIASGRPADALLAHAEDAGADLIVVGSRGLGAVESALVGSVSAAVVDHAPCPVLVARRSTVSRIVLATDGSRSAEAIPAVLAAWDLLHGVPVDVLAVRPSSPLDAASVSWVLGGDRRQLDASHDVDRHRVLAEEMATRLTRAGWRARPVVRRGDAAHEIEAFAAEQGADLIITGSRGLSGLQRLLLGSVAHHVLLHSRSSVLVMRGHVAARERRRGLVRADAGA